MLRRRRLWARLLVIPALWSAVVAMSAAPIHPCGGVEHGSAGAAVDAEHTGHAEHHPHALAAEPSDAGSRHDESGTCECFDCGAPAVIAALPMVELHPAAERLAATRLWWPAAARARERAPAHWLPFANGPPQS